MAFTTRLSLLSRVRKGDGVSWKEFYETYKPLIKLCGNDCMLSPTECDDLVQLVMCEIFQKDILNKYKKDYVRVEAYYKHDESKGHFRNYFRGIVRNQALKIVGKRDDNPSLDDEDNHLKNRLSKNSWDRMWNTEWKKHVFAMALQELRQTVDPNTYVAFEMYALQHRPIKEITDFLGMKRDSIYTAKKRCLEAMKKLIIELEDK